MTMRELRNTRKLKEWLRAGKSVELRDRNNLIGRIVPPTPQEPATPVEWPDFEARHRELFGDRVFNAVEDFLQDRHGRY
jgi:hypothetical protein